VHHAAKQENREATDLVLLSHPAILTVERPGKNWLCLRKFAELWQNNHKITKISSQIMQPRSILLLLGGWFFFWASSVSGADFDTAYHAYQVGDHVEASRGFQHLARGGHAQAQYLLGLLYLNGQGVGKAPETGIDWLKRSAQNGYYLAAVELGQVYGSGRGVPMDSAEAARWITLSTRLATDADAEQECE
jgi:TPR repeat protein